MNAALWIAERMEWVLLVLVLTTLAFWRLSKADKVITEAEQLRDARRRAGTLQ